MAEPLLKIENLTKSFGENTILRDVNLDVKSGEVIVLVGPSGCGKTTFLRCINALEELDGGSISVEGVTVTKKRNDLVALRQKIGMVFQSYDLFPHLTVLENVCLAPQKVQKRERTAVEQEARELLARVGLSDKADMYPRQLSGGQKQRVAIVRMLIMHPEVLLFD